MMIILRITIILYYTQIVNSKLRFRNLKLYLLNFFPKSGIKKRQGFYSLLSCYVYNPSTEDYIIGDWSTANEIKSWHIYEQFKGIRGSNLPDKLPKAPIEE